MKTTFKDFTISSEYIGNKLWSVDGWTQNYNNHKITVSFKGKKTSFDYWGSMMQPEIQSEQDLLNAFSCFLSDSLSAKENFEGFCIEFGYSTDSRNAERIYKACEKSLKKMERIYEGDLYDLANELNETING